MPSTRHQTTSVLTDLARLDLRDGGLRVVSRCPGVTHADLRAATGFTVEDAGDTAAAPTEAEKRALGRLDPTGLRHRMI
jgi:acyl CoA:acetate/3-ketoacid CoA transferase beta subunit